jgi:hypothetical protein
MSYKSAYDIAEAFGYLTEAEVDGTKEIVRNLPENSMVVVIGVGAGTSSVAIAEEREDLHLISVDISVGGPFGGLENERNAFELRGLNMLGRHEQVLADSKEHAKRFAHEVDFVFIDGDHSYEGCMGDIQGWFKHVKKGGYVAIHDYGGDNWPMVEKATDEFFDGHEPVLLNDSLIVFRK